MADGGVLPLIDEACDASLMGGEEESPAPGNSLRPTMPEKG